MYEVFGKIAIQLKYNFATFLFASKDIGFALFAKMIEIYCMTKLNLQYVLYGHITLFPFLFVLSIPHNIKSFSIFLPLLLVFFSNKNTTI